MALVHPLPQEKTSRAHLARSSVIGVASTSDGLRLLADTGACSMASGSAAAEAVEPLCWNSSGDSRPAAATAGRVC